MHAKEKCQIPNQCAFLTGFCNGPLTDNGETPELSPPGRDTDLASHPEAEQRPDEADESLAAGAASTASADTSATSERKSSSEDSEQNNEQRDIFRDLSDHEDTLDTSLQCDHCSDKFMSAQSMRIHAVRCRSRQQSEQPDTGMQRSEDIRR